MSETGSPNVAMQNFMQNTLRGMDSGGSSAPSNGSIALLSEVDDLRAAAQQKMTFNIFGTIIAQKFIQGMQGFANSVDLGSLGLMSGQTQIPTLPLAGGQKIANLMGRR
jgi:hypothetical protein